MIVNINYLCLEQGLLNMGFKLDFEKQFELLIKVLPSLNACPRFALKGGTAINLFFQNMPRLSVDIDLTYTEVETRKIFLENLSIELNTLKKHLLNAHPDLIIKEVLTKDGTFSKLLVFQKDVQIKIEPNLVFRGRVYECEQVELCEVAQEKYLRYFELKTMSKQDVYAGKICAALDRQHPRDLYDIKLLFEQGGISKELQKAFVVYLVCSPRPMNELLNPNPIDIAAVYHNEFMGMTEHEISLNQLLATREALIKTIQTNLTDAERKFILSAKLGTPDLALLGLPNHTFPGLEWKVINIQKMDKAKHNAAVDKLKKVLQV